MNLAELAILAGSCWSVQHASDAGIELTDRLERSIDQGFNEQRAKVLCGLHLRAIGRLKHLSSSKLGLENRRARAVVAPKVPERLRAERVVGRQQFLDPARHKARQR